MSTQKEFWLKGEDKVHSIAEGLFSKYRCACGGAAAVHQKGDLFRVECRTLALGHALVNLEGKFVGTNHTDSTPWLPSSPDAIQHWKLVATLSRV